MQKSAVNIIRLTLCKSWKHLFLLIQNILKSIRKWVQGVPEKTLREK